MTQTKRQPSNGKTVMIMVYPDGHTVLANSGVETFDLTFPTPQDAYVFWENFAGISADEFQIEPSFGDGTTFADVDLARLPADLDGRPQPPEVIQ